MPKTSKVLDRLYMGRTWLERASESKFRSGATPTNRADQSPEAHQYNVRFDHLKVLEKLCQACNGSDFIQGICQFPRRVFHNHESPIPGTQLEVQKTSILMKTMFKILLRSL